MSKKLIVVLTIFFSVYGCAQENKIVKNNKIEPVNIVVVEQYPITKQKEILISVIKAEGAINNEKIGKLEWKSTLNPNQKQEFKYQYLTKYPSYINVD